MIDYAQEVHNAAKNKTNKRFPNSTIRHAKILIKEIINQAKNEIYLLSSNFNEEFYRTLEDQIKNFFNRTPDSKFFLIITSQGANSFLNELKNNYDDRFIITHIDEKKLPVDPDTNEYVNYIVNDQNAFRYEYSDKDVDIGVVEAIANFNSKKESKELIEYFKSLIS